MKKILCISDATTLAMHTLGVLAVNGEKVQSTKELASLLNASEHHLSKVLQRLAKSGFIRSVRGPTGGFCISQGWEETKLMEIYELMEGSFRPSFCLLGNPVCREGHCILGNLLKDINNQIEEVFDKTKLKDLVDSFNKKKDSRI